MLDKSRKGISNEAIKLRIRKDAAAFGAEDMPTDVRSNGKFLGVRNLEEEIWHLCENND